MRFLLTLGLAGFCALTESPARAAPVTDPAAVFPEHTLLYAEIHQPGKLLEEIDGLFKGSALDNVPDSLARFNARRQNGKAENLRTNHVLGVLGLFLSPELRRETARVRGAGIGLTGFRANGQPDFVAVILPGRSSVPMLLLRTFLATGQAEVVATVDGVAVYGQAHGFGFAPSAPSRVYIAPTGTAPAPPPAGLASPQAPPPPPAFRRQPVQAFGSRENEPVFAHTSGAILIGSRQAVTDAIHRLKGKAEGKSLAETDGLQQARKQSGEHPGIFGYASVPQFVKSIARGRLPGAAGLVTFKDLFNPDAFRYEAISLTLQDGTLRYQQLVGLDPNEKSPLLGTFPSRPVSTEVLHFAPRDALFAAALSNAEGQQRWAQIMKIADQIAKLTNHEGNLPSEQVDQAEGALGISVGKDILGRIKTLGVAMDNPLVGMSARAPMPPGTPPFVFVLEASDAKAADALLLDVLPKLLRAAGQGDAPPAAKVAGQSIHRVEINGKSVCYGQHDATIVIGLQAKRVAAALSTGAKKEGLLADQKIREKLAKLDHPVGVFVSKPLPVFASLFYVVRSSSSTFGGPTEVIRRTAPPRPQPTDKESRAGKARVIRAALQPPGADEAAIAHGNGPDDMAKLVQGFMRQANRMGPFVISLRRAPDRFELMAEQTDLKPGVARLTNWVLEQYFKDRATAARGRKLRPRQPPPPSTPPQPRP